MRSFQRPVDPVHQNISPSYPPAAALHFLSAALRIHPPTVTIPVYILLPRDRTFFFFAVGQSLSPDHPYNFLPEARYLSPH